MRKNKIVVVFDLDETLGSFVQLSVLKDVIERYEDRELTQGEFNQLIEENPEFLRPGIIEILNYAVDKRDNGLCDAVMIYTNNTGGRSWTNSISEYFNYKLGREVFDQHILAYMVNGRKLEQGRTTHDKTYQDFLRCTDLPSNTKVCFFDDVLHPDMQHPNVTYINPKPYSHRIPVNISVERLYGGNSVDYKECMREAYNIYKEDTLIGENKTFQEQDVDAIIGKHMLMNLDKFFKTHVNKKPYHLHGGSGRGRASKRKRNRL